MNDVGFTGPRTGMTQAQHFALARLLGDRLRPHTFHHGDCVGSDEQAHELARAITVPVIIHPPVDERLRAFCQGAVFTHDPLPYRDRNQVIVDASTRLVATPSGFVEERQSGTWMTVRMARRAGVPVTAIWPDGTLLHEGAPRE